MKLSKMESDQLEPAVAYALEKLDSLQCIDGLLTFRPTQVADMLRFISKILPDLESGEARHLLHADLCKGRMSESAARERLLRRIRIALAIRNEQVRLGDTSDASGRGRGRNLTDEEIEWVTQAWDRDLSDYPDDKNHERWERLAVLASDVFGYPWKPRRIKTALERRAIV